MKISIPFLLLIILMTSLITYGLCHLWDGVSFPIISRAEYGQLVARQDRIDVINAQLNSHINGIDQYLGKLIQEKVLPKVER